MEHQNCDDLCTHKSLTNTPTSKCCERPVFCRCMEHGGKCHNCGKDRWKEPTPTPPTEKCCKKCGAIRENHS